MRKIKIAKIKKITRRNLINKKIDQIELDFEKAKNEVIEILEKNRIWALATSLNDKVTSRSVSIVNCGLNIYFQTSKSFEKYKQISENKNVSLCYFNVSVEGFAYDIGSWHDKENREILKIYKEIHPDSYKNYGSLKNEVVIKVVPQKITIWKYLEGKPYRDYIYVPEEKAFRELYQED